MPVRPTIVTRGRWGLPSGWTPAAGDVVLLGAVFNVIYAAGVVYALAGPNGPAGFAIGKWIGFSRNLLGPVYTLAGRVGCGGGEVSPFVARAWEFDVHLMAVNLIVVVALIAASRRYWANWSGELYGTLGRLGLKGIKLQHGADVGYVAVLCGVIAALGSLLGNDLFHSAARCSAFEPWMLLRVPALATVAHGLASVAAAFWVRREE